MIKTYKIIIAGCMTLLFVNGAGLFFIIQKQTRSFDAVQRLIIAEQRRPSPSGPEKESARHERVSGLITNMFENIPPVFSLPEQAGKIASLIDQNHLVSEKRLLFRPQEKDNPFSGKDLISYSTTMTLGGSYGDVKGFLADIQNLPNLVTMDELNLVRISGSGLSLNLKLSLFLRKNTDG